MIYVEVLSFDLGEKTEVFYGEIPAV